MSASPKWKVFSPSGEYVASTKYVEDAAAIVASYGEGAQIRASHRKRDTVYTDGIDGDAAASYDVVAEAVQVRMGALRQQWHAEHEAAIARTNAVGGTVSVELDVKR